MANSQTTNYNLLKPAHSDANWDTPINANFDSVDSLLKQLDTSLTSLQSQINSLAGSNAPLVSMNATGPANQLSTAGTLDYYVVPAALTLRNIIVSCMTTPATGSFVFDVLKNGTSILGGTPITLTCNGTIQGLATTVNVSLAASDIVTFVITSGPTDTASVIVKVELY
jgi:hypothetical protein